MREQFERCEVLLTVHKRANHKEGRHTAQVHESRKENVAHQRSRATKHHAERDDHGATRDTNTYTSYEMPIGEEVLRHCTSIVSPAETGGPYQVQLI